MHGYKASIILIIEPIDLNIEEFDLYYRCNKDFSFCNMDFSFCNKELKIMVEKMLGRFLTRDDELF